MSEDRSHYSDRKFSLRDVALLVTIFMTVGTQVTSIAWFASKVETTQRFTERTLNDVRDDVKAAASAVQAAITAGAVQKQQIDNVLERLSRLELRR